MVDGDGRATGVLSTLTLLPGAVGSNNFSDLHRAVEYMRSHGGPNATLALGTEPFDPDQLPLGTGSPGAVGTGDPQERIRGRPPRAASGANHGAPTATPSGPRLVGEPGAR
jgi:hypothetical protein